MPKPREMIGEPKQRFIVKELSVLAALPTGKLGLTEVGNQAKPRKYSEQKLYLLPNLWQCSNARAPTSIHSRQRRSRDGRVRSENGRLLSDGCCCLMRPSAESTSHRHLQRSLDWTWRANDLASPVTGPHTKWTSSYTATLKP